MPMNTLAGRTFEVDDEGFLVRREDWDEQLAAELAKMMGQELTDEHWAVLRFIRNDSAVTGNTPTMRRIQVEGGYEIVDLFRLFPDKPMKKMAYLAGLKMPAGCV